MISKFDQKFCIKCGRPLKTDKVEASEYDGITGRPITWRHRKRCPKVNWAYGTNHTTIEVYLRHA